MNSTVSTVSNNLSDDRKSNKTTSNRPTQATDWRFKLLFDGECPFCRVEAQWMSQMSRNGALVLEDIAAPDFDASRYGKTLDELMGSIHGVFPDGSMTVGVETFRQTYRALGLGWLLAPTAWPILRPLVDFGYRLFARNRIAIGRLFGRPSCQSDRCSVIRK